MLPVASKLSLIMNVTETIRSLLPAVRRGEDDMLPVLAYIALLLVDEDEDDDDDDDDIHGGRVAGSKNIKRQRVEVNTIFTRLGERFVRKAYRMSEQSFWKLYSILEPGLKENKKERKNGGTPNGPITSSARLSMALRWFAGGEPADIMQTHGVGYDEVYNSVWLVVDVVNKCEALQIRFPDDHASQQLVASGFKSKSKVNFSNCVGCIDGMLVWINKPSQRSLDQECPDGEATIAIGPKK